jgi:O-antigen ligase
MKINHQSLFIAGVAIACLIFSPFILDFTLTPRFIALAALMLATFQLAHRRDFSWKIDLVMAAYCAYAFFCCVSTAWAINKAEAIFESGRVVLGLFVFGYLSHISGSEKTRGNLLKTAMFICLVALAAGFYQLVRSGSLKKEDVYLVTGISGHKNLFASFLVLNFFFLWLAFRDFKGRWKVLAETLITLSVLMLFILRTRAVVAGGISAAVCFFVFSIIQKRRKEMTLKSVYILSVIFLLLANIFFMAILPSVLSKVAGRPGAEPGKYSALVPDPERVMLWHKTYHLVDKNTLAGTGAGNWQVQFPDATLTGLYRAEDLNYTFQRPHNDLLWILSETGLIGFNLYLLFIFLMLFYALKLHIEGQRDALPGAIIISAFMAVSFFDFPRERIEHIIFFSLILGMLHSRIQSSNSVQDLIIKMRPSLARLFFSIVALFITFAGMLRYRGEFHSRKMYDEKAKGNLNGVIRQGKSAMSFAYTLDPTSVPIPWYTGNAQAILGNYGQAKNDFIHSHSLNPYNRNVLNDLASACALTGDTTSAIQYYLVAARISPRFDEPKLNLAALYIRQNKYMEARAVLNSLYHDSPRRSDYEVIVNMKK